MRPGGATGAAGVPESERGVGGCRYKGGVADWDEDARAELRAAAHRRDARRGLAVLGGRPIGPVLQYAGDVVLAALEEALPGADRLARACAEGLTARGGPGDAELAAELRAALAGTATPLEDAPVDLGVLGARLDADPSEGVHVVDLRTGDIDTDPPPFDTAGGPGRVLTFVPEGPRGTGGGPADEEAQRGRARAWLAAHGYRPGPRPFL